MYILLIISGGSLPMFISIHFCNPVVSFFNESNFATIKKHFIIYLYFLTKKKKTKQKKSLLPYALVLCILSVTCLISSEINASGPARLFLNSTLRISETGEE